jgi:hypothetical protein
MNHRRGIIGLAIVLAVSAGALGRQPAASPVQVEPAELARRQDLVGREIVVDDRVSYYVTRAGSEDDELQLKRTAVTFLVPRRLRPAAHSRIVAAVVRGILERQGSRLICRVTGLDLKPADLDRLNAGAGQLGPRDYQTRRAWARWAEHRAAEFGDDALMRRARALEAEALRIEGDDRRVSVDAPAEWLAKAIDARRRKVPEPEPSAWAHRAFRARLAAANDPAGLRTLAQQVESFFPEARDDRGSAEVRVGRVDGPYAEDPAAAYRDAPPRIRKALDRRLWADVQERLLESEPTADLSAAIARSEQAAARLPERPELAARLLEKAAAAARSDPGALRLADVKALADVYRSRLRRPDDAQQVLRDWLQLKQSKLSGGDAEGRLAMAGLYEELVQDRVTAVELLRKAWQIDPNSREIAEAFRVRGYRRDKDQWVEADAGDRAAPSGAQPDATRPARAESSSLLGLTPEELERKLITKPSYKNYVASQGQLIEQRVYLDTRSVRYVNLLHNPRESRPRVIADYSLPRRERKGGPSPAR